MSIDIPEMEYSGACPCHHVARPTSVTIAIRPSGGRDGGGYRFDLGDARRENFWEWDWTGRINILTLSLLVRVNPDVRRDLSGFRRLDHGAAVEAVAVSDDRVAFATLFFQPSNSTGSTALRPPGGMSSGSKVRSS
jgi:hypothetical protein